MSMVVAVVLAAVLLGSCASEDRTRPMVAVVAPALASAVSGVVPVQVSATDDRGVVVVELFVRGKGGSGRGVRVGSAVEAPLVVSWNSVGQPNLAELELLAVARDAAGNEGVSAAVAVRTQNAGVPSLERLYAFTVPLQAVAASLSGGLGAGVLPDSTPTVGIVPPNASPAVSVPAASVPLRGIEGSAVAERSFALEWQVAPFAGADGYGLYVGAEDVAGPYELLGRYGATASGGSQAYSVFLEAAAPGDEFFGVASTVSGGATVESGFSNADGAVFLPAQVVGSPADGALVGSGRPSLTWTPTAGAVGYLFYVYDKDPWASDATLLWSNYPNSVSGLSVAYPAERAALASGAYFWWVAGVSFDALGKADGFSFSDTRRFVVP